MRLDDKKDPLVKLNTIIPREIFRPRLRSVWREPGRERRSNAGRKPWDEIVMFKAIILWALYNLSDEQVEYQGMNCQENLPLRVFRGTKRSEHWKMRKKPCKSIQKHEKDIPDLPTRLNHFPYSSSGKETGI